MTLEILLAVVVFWGSFAFLTPRSVPSRMPRSGSSFFPRFLRSLALALWAMISVGIYTGAFSTPPTVSTPLAETMYVLDISYSMLAEDLPSSRLEFIKDALVRDLTRAQSGRFWAVLFAGRPFLLSRSTDDRQHLSRLIGSVTTDSINQALPDMAGTNLGDGLLLSEKGFSDSAPARRIVLITDGEANQGIEPTDVAKYLCSKGISLTVIGIGSSDGVPLVTTDSFGRKRPFVERWEPIITRLDTDLLSRVSWECNWSFTQISHPSDGPLLHRTLASPEMPSLQSAWVSESATSVLLYLLITVALSLELAVFVTYRLW